MIKFDPYALTHDDKKFLIKIFIGGCNSSIWTEREINSIWAILTIAGFDVTSVLFHQGRIEVVTGKDNERASLWLNNLIHYTTKAVRCGTMANLDNITEQVLPIVELATPLMPIPLMVGWVSPHVLLEMPPVMNPEIDYPWFVAHTKPGDDVPNLRSPVGIHGPECGGVMRRILSGVEKGKHFLVCEKCGFSINIPSHLMTFEELKKGIQNDFAVEKKAGKVKGDGSDKGKKFNPNMARTGPRPWMRKKERR